ncbi:MAG: Crp/Fnr family transcriptional regulator [Rhodobacter sp.]|jgi:CRP-like cAMP-binding protein|nr:Crp/Fnr family transcriptional regulator [Rhodobacter sp.]MBK8438488.1 Crp/Fnr family transcriptional regulator [Rhodobacter sp.]
MKETEHPCAKCSFHAQSLWQPVAGAALSTLARSFTRRELDEGGTLYHQGVPSDGVYCVSRGLIAIRTFGPDGGSSLLRLAYPGDLVGYRAFLTGRGHRTEARALMPSRVCVVARHDAQRVVQACPAVLARLAERCADDLDRYQERIQEIARLPNKARLLRLLDQLMTAHGEAEGDIRSMRLPISRRDLADVLGVQPETLSRLMKRLEAEGLLRSSGRMIVIRQRPPDRPWSEACRG